MYMCININIEMFTLIPWDGFTKAHERVGCLGPKYDFLKSATINTKSVAR